MTRLETKPFVGRGISVWLSASTCVYVIWVMATGERRTIPLSMFFFFFSVTFSTISSFYVFFFTRVNSTERRKNPIWLCLEDRGMKLCALWKDKRQENFFLFKNDEIWGDVFQNEWVLLLWLRIQGTPRWEACLPEVQSLTYPWSTLWEPQQTDW